ncbi:hypothetical protein C1H46_037572 [Malus baccata]|uniref:Uncharacterized protein n=1 Tax=Malus baccata TaxID=106549 RepID=A0A540KRP2_MALBA|nr:hypothetical protein C1H46_037572 [Malus baccata]
MWETPEPDTTPKLYTRTLQKPWLKNKARKGHEKGYPWGLRDGKSQRGKREEPSADGRGEERKNKSRKTRGKGKRPSADGRGEERKSKYKKPPPIPAAARISGTKRKHDREITHTIW